MSKNELIVKSNQVVEASYTLTTVEQRLILSAIAQIPKGGDVTDEYVYRVSVEDLKRFGANETTAYRDLKEGLNRLYDRSIILRSSDRTQRTRWVQMIDYLDSKGIVGVRFSKDILPFLSNLSTEFTKYLASDLIGITSAHAIRLYELLVQYRSVGKREITVEDLRWMFELQDKYPVWADLKRWVIDQSLKEINKFSPLNVTYDTKKTGKKITSIVFKFQDKKALKAPKEKASSSNYGRIDEPPKGMTGIGSITNAMMQKNTNTLAHRVSRFIQQIQGDPELQKRLKRPDENFMQMAKRIREDITSDELADHFEAKLLP
ncbi:RepB family plasmid replication initiator protein [Acinetobacter baumannii]|nr:RepB family plasmid replication initiator protein [Acinetobacter baumannii]